MSKQIPQLLKGFRDFLPTEKRKRDFVMRKIVETFENFGFDPLETPTIEYKDTIMGKYGEEADKLVYEFKDRGDREVALRYDQTVPTARVIANYQNDLPFPFRRYQTQNVFRADKPQKGRYREFTQCDIDIFGSTDSVADAEILACVYAAFKNIGFNEIKLKVNDRESLFAILNPFATATVPVLSIIQTLDKLDKLEKAEVISELVKKGLSDESATACLTALEKAVSSKKLSEIINIAVSLGVEEKTLVFSPSTARGLDYYTGMIFEVTIPGYEVGSVGGGGRYDNLINDLSGITMPAVGMAFGFDRTVEAAEQLGLLTKEGADQDVLVTIFDETLIEKSAQIANTLRMSGVSVELYPRLVDLSKQLKYADKKGIRYVVVIGPDEVKNNEVVLKDLNTGEQKKVSPESILTHIQ